MRYHHSYTHLLRLSSGQALPILRTIITNMYLYLTFIYSELLDVYENVEELEKGNVSALFPPSCFSIRNT